MMKRSHYRCASTEAPAEATLVCNQEGCAVYPFLCGRPSCVCMTLHHNHQLKALSGLLETLAVPPKLPENVAKEQKYVEGFIERLIGKLESLKKRHKTHIERHTLGSRRYAGLMQRLTNGDQLQTKEANGDTIAKMIAKISQHSTIKSPYSVGGEQLCNVLQVIEGTTQQLIAQIEQLWVQGQVVEKSIKVVEKKAEKPVQKPVFKPVANMQQTVQKPPPPVFKFSSQMRHQGIILSKTGTTAIGINWLGTPLVVVEPRLSSNTPYQTVFKINSSRIDVAVGVCLPRIISANGYQLNGNFPGYAELYNQHGTFMINKHGDCFNHGNQMRETALQFSAGQSVVVEWQPGKREVWWRVVGTNKRHCVSIPIGLLQWGPLHFVAELYDGSEVSVGS